MVLLLQQLFHRKQSRAQDIHLQRIGTSEGRWAWLQDSLPVAGPTVPSERSFTSYTVSFTCVCWLMHESWKKAMLLR